jgi:hypothetical protein
MPVFYSVVQYVPDPARGERLNVGVIVFGEGRVHSRFVENWSRVRAFGEENIGFLRSFARHSDLLTEQQVRKIAGAWHASIQLTEPAGSLLSPADLLVDAASRYLRAASPQSRPYRTRKQAVTLARQTVREVVTNQLGPQAERLVKNNLSLAGPRGEHEFDVGARNGRPYFAARALSFEAARSSDLLRQIESTEFAIEDVRREEHELPLAVVVLPPKEGLDDTLFQRAIGNFAELGANVIEEQDLPEWALNMASLLAEGWHHGT